jgi:hypothetical protein
VEGDRTPRPERFLAGTGSTALAQTVISRTPPKTVAVRRHWVEDAVTETPGGEAAVAAAGRGAGAVAEAAATAAVGQAP